MRRKTGVLVSKQKEVVLNFWKCCRD